MSSDIRSILQRLTDLEEGKTTPVTVKKGQNPQQKSVPQLPALFKPRHISVLGADKDPEHPAKGYAVGANESKLAETMQSVEEDMLNKVKQDLTVYLDKLEKKNRSDRDLIDKAKDAVERGQAEEFEEEIDTDPAAMQGPSAPLDSETAHNIELSVQNKLNAPQQPQAPQATFEMDNGECIECWGDEQQGYRLRRQGREMPTRFDKLDHVKTAVALYQAKQKKKQRQSDADYIEER